MTFGAATPLRPVWTQDGARIAYSTPEGVAANPAGSVVLASAAQPDQARAGKVDGAICEPLVYLIGDISPAAESELRALGYSAQRFTGTPSDVTAAAMQHGVYESVMVLDESDRQVSGAISPA